MDGGCHKTFCGNHTICVFDLAKARSLSKRFKTFKHGAGQVYPVNYSVAWLCCSSCCSYVAVVLQFKSTQHSKTPFTGAKAFGSGALLRLPQLTFGKKYGIHELHGPNSRPLKPWPKLRRRNVTSTVLVFDHCPQTQTLTRQSQVVFSTFSILYMLVILAIEPSMFDDFKFLLLTRQLPRRSASSSATRPDFRSTTY